MTRRVLVVIVGLVTIGCNNTTNGTENDDASERDTGTVADGDTDTDTDGDTDTDTDSDTDTDTDTDTDSDTDTDTDSDTDTDTDTDTDSDGDTDSDLDTDTNPLTVDAGLDAGNDTDWLDGCNERPGGSLFGTHLLRFESADRSIRVFLERFYVDWGVGESALYDVNRIDVWMDDTCSIIEDPEQLEYTNTHHNWMDVVTAADNAVRYQLSLTYIGVEPLGWECLLGLTDIESGDSIAESISLIPSGGPWTNNGGPWDVPVIINEFMVLNESTWQDSEGEFEPWIEIFNPSSSDVDVSGYTLSNDPDQPTLWSIPEGTVIPRHEYLVIAADNEPSEGTLHTSFRLSPDGGFIMLSTPDGVSEGERPYGTQTTGTSMIADYATDGYVPSDSPTPGLEN